MKYSTITQLFTGKKKKLSARHRSHRTKQLKKISHTHSTLISPATPETYSHLPQIHKWVIIHVVNVTFAPVAPRPAHLSRNNPLSLYLCALPHYSYWLTVLLPTYSLSLSLLVSRDLLASVVEMIMRRRWASADENNSPINLAYWESRVIARSAIKSNRRI